MKRRAGKKREKNIPWRRIKKNKKNVERDEN